MKTPKPTGKLENRKLAWPPQISKEAWQEALREREEQLKKNAPPVPVVFPVDKDDQ